MSNKDNKNPSVPFPGTGRRNTNDSAPIIPSPSKGNTGGFEHRGLTPPTKASPPVPPPRKK